MLVNYQLIQHHIPEDLILYRQHCENFKSHTYQLSHPYFTNLPLEDKYRYCKASVHTYYRNTSICLLFMAFLKVNEVILKVFLNGIYLECL